MTLAPVDAALIAEFTSRLGPAGVSAPQDAPRYFEEPRGKFPGQAALVVRPASTEEVAYVVGRAAERRAAIIPWGGGTGLVGGQTTLVEPLPILLSLERMTRVRAVSTDENAMIVEAGLVLARAQAAAEEAGRLFPLSLASEGSCTIGGCLSANAGGVGVLRYGNMRDLCLGIEAVTPDGRVMNRLSVLRKDNRGYDLRNLLIGAEGTLGVITAAALKLFPRPAATATAFVAVDSPAAAVSLLRRLQEAAGDTVSAFELLSAQGVAFVTNHIEGARTPFDAPHPWFALVDVASDAPEPPLLRALEAALEDGLARDAVVAQSEAQRAALWRIREETPIANRIVGAIASHDVSVPIAALPDYIAVCGRAIAEIEPRLRINCFGHVGDGNLHYNIFAPEGERPADWKSRAAELTEIVHAQAALFGGSFSAEHGVGRAKVGDLERYGDPVALDMMRAVKRALDPNGIMNPGAVLDPAKLDVAQARLAV